MGKVLIHPELIELFTTFKVADIDYEDNKGSSNAHEFADLAMAAQGAFRDRKAELEADGVEIWSEADPYCICGADDAFADEEELLSNKCKACGGQLV